MTSAPPIPGRPKHKRGGQPSNTNALRHGFYSKSFWEAELQALDTDLQGEFLDELNAVRTNMARLAELMKDYKNMSLEEFVTASNALNNFVDRIQSLSRAQRFIYHNHTTTEQAFMELAHLPPEQD